ncbi:hypothetical protein F5876DRAFT_81779 [Lentinula aff. lateritia]|uniref:Uncharacterized protein n=1 Tax=Lentinula aff. lateritia TaxID=2804960 RepID=A0ACC1TLG2_9AGAR|nr:hypothetical protein F5876DRAFT_81779 [Lentinula aff. lateritia]
MVMLGKGTAIRADIALLKRLNLLIHGDGKFGSPHASFDISLTSPAASIPDTILWLNRFAGTARQEAYKMIIRYHDLYTETVYSNTPSFDWRIKRSAARDGFNLILPSR